jgi:hypothetical protein
MGGGGEGKYLEKKKRNKERRKGRERNTVKESEQKK